MKKENIASEWKQFLKLCSTLKNPEEFDRFFNLFLTLEEKEDLTTRYVIVRSLLEKKMTQRKIAETYGVSIAKITRGSNALKITDDNLKRLITS
jgi:TrpR family trp operon transcriptional repressor